MVREGESGKEGGRNEGRRMAGQVRTTVVEDSYQERVALPPVETPPGTCLLINVHGFIALHVGYWLSQCRYKFYGQTISVGRHFNI